LKKKRQALYATNFSATKLLHSRQMPQNKEAEFKEKKKGSKKKKNIRQPVFGNGRQLSY
jgi:hypothetical protein